VDRLVVTDHNTIQGALKAKDLDPERVIVGEEILTRQGELLAAFVTEEIPKNLPVMEAIARLKEQGAFISVSHPFDRGRSPWGEEGLLAILPQVDAIETFNARCFPPGYNHQAQDFANEHGVLGTAGSDAHTLYEVGRAAMRLPWFEGAAGLRRAMPKAEYLTQLSGPWVRLSSRYAVLRKKLGGLPRP
jgi:hypothetical protein